MSASDPASKIASPGNWLANQPYLLLCITALCWAGNAIVGRLAAGHIPPVTLAFLRWSLAFLIILPFTWKHLKRDWGTIRSHLGIMILLSLTGVGIFTSLQYWSLEHTTALTAIEFNKGDIIFTVALVIFGLYSVLSLKGPQIDGLSMVGFTFGCGS